MSKLTVERLKEVLSYDPETGSFVRLTKAAQRTKIGEIAGGLDERGYLRIRVDGKKYKAHRLAWFYMTGEWPSLNPDHKDLDKGNNRWENLRLATRGQNKANTLAQKDNTSGFKGVTWHKKQKEWTASITQDGKKFHLGSFGVCKAAAHFAYVIAADEKFGEYARG